MSSTSHKRIRYTPTLVGAGATVKITSDSVGGFLCTTAGAITIVRNNDDGTTTTIVNALAVSAGTWIDIPFYLGVNGGSITSTTAVGTLGT